jgi:hypothetical protein
LCSPKTEVSFIVKIDELQESETRLICEVNKWRNQAATDLELRHRAEEKVNRLELVIQQARNDNEKLGHHIEEWKLVAEQSQSIVIKYRDGMSRFFVLLAELKSELPFN